MTKRLYKQYFVLKMVILQLFTGSTHFIYSSYYNAISDVLSEDQPTALIAKQNSLHLILMTKNRPKKRMVK